MRAIILVLILLVVAALIALATGLVDITQTRGAKAPEISAAKNGVSARGGQTPAFDIQTGGVAVGTTQANVVVPTVKVVPPNESANQASNNAQ